MKPVFGGFGTRLKFIKFGHRRNIICCSSLFESTEMKIARKRRIEPGWSSQAGAVRLEKSGWSSQAGAVRLEQSGWRSQAGSVRIEQSDGSSQDGAVRRKQPGWSSQTEAV